MAGIYIHVPFCRKACHYCNFHFSTSLKGRDELVDALIREMELTSMSAATDGGYLGKETIETIYFGGGTPSLLPAKQLERIVTNLHKHFTIDSNAEITFEANPDDISMENLKEWRDLGINRLSIGVQSFYEEHLRWMNRAHSAVQSFTAIEAAQHVGIKNISIDLIYGLPGMTNEQWADNLEKALAINVPHLSCYALTVEPSTALHKMILQKKTADVDDALQEAHFAYLAEWAPGAGYEQYEISNLAKPGMRSRHNSSYWQGKKYLGLGPSAHSFNGSSRQWNVANNALYIKSLKENKLPAEIEVLTITQQYNEYIMTSLRTMEGIDTGNVLAKFGKDYLQHLEKSAARYLAGDKLMQTGDAIVLTAGGKFFADGIASELFK